MIIGSKLRDLLRKGTGARSISESAVAEAHRIVQDALNEAVREARHRYRTELRERRADGKGCALRLNASHLAVRATIEADEESASVGNSLAGTLPPSFAVEKNR